jgi:SAM-dependent methyltransferase
MIDLSMELALNVGSGNDMEGDVRLDAKEAIYGFPFRCRPDVYADAHFLPFRDRAFSFVKCSHVLEHLANPRLALKEITRVCSGRAEIRFPLADGMKRPALLALTALDLGGVVTAIRARAWREHKWQINPDFVKNLATDFEYAVQVNKKAPFMFRLVTQGRKGSAFRRLLSFIAIDYEYQVNLVRAYSQVLMGKQQPNRILPRAPHPS